MTTKAQIQAIAANVGATFEERYNVFGEYEVCITLPKGHVWDNGNETGIIIDYLKPGDDEREFWNGIKYYIHWNVVAERPRMPYEVA